MALCPIVCERVHFQNVKGREEHTKPEACFMSHPVFWGERYCEADFEVFLGESAHRTTASLISLLYQSWVLFSNKGGRATFDTHMSHDRLSRLRLYTIYSSLTWELCCCYRKPYAVVCLGVWAWDEMCLFLSTFCHYVHVCAWMSTCAPHGCCCPVRPKESIQKPGVGVAGCYESSDKDSGN